MQNTGIGIVSKIKFKKQCENYIFETAPGFLYFNK